MCIPSNQACAFLPSSDESAESVEFFHAVLNYSTSALGSGPTQRDTTGSLPTFRRTSPASLRLWTLARTLHITFRTALGRSEARRRTMAKKKATKPLKKAKALE